MVCVCGEKFVLESDIEGLKCWGFRTGEHFCVLLGWEVAFSVVCRESVDKCLPPVSVDGGHSGEFVGFSGTETVQRIAVGLLSKWADPAQL